MAINVVYKITNILNNKFYIGSTINFNKRKWNHLWKLNKGIHDNCYLQKSFSKNGINNFKFEILEENINNLLEREQYYMDILKPQYNILKLAYSTYGSKRSEETKLKMRNAALGVIPNIESRNKMRISKLGTIGNHIKSVHKLDNSNNILASYISITEASKQENIGRTSINNCVKGLSKMAGGFKWKYIND